ncbi:MAG: patatin-like phospholipase family protein [Acidimicrobiales bacterium]|nr:patatin-like phospholipase family protein [Acidimicrobiales bacterium]
MRLRRRQPPSHDAGDFLADVSLFAQLPASARADLARGARWVYLPAGSYLFREGDPADDLAVVWSGRLEVLRQIDPKGHEQEVVGTFARGATVGELSLLTSEPRSASVRALRDTELLVVNAAVFERVMLREPGLGLAVARALAQRLRHGYGSLKHPDTPHTIAIIPFDPGLPIQRFLDRFIQTVAQYGGVVVAEEADDNGMPDGRPTGITHGDSAERREQRWAARLDRLEDDFSFVLLVSRHPTVDLAWTRFCLRSADRVLFMLRAGAPPAAVAKDDRALGRDLVFVSSALKTEQIAPARRHLQPRALHHLPDDGGFDAAVDRIARRMTKHAIGLVFSGGGARGLAHIGVIERLQDAGIEIDRAGGCSAGAMAAAMVAAGWSADEILEICRRELVDHKPFSDFTVPREGLIKGKRVSGMLERIFGDVCIEELARPLFVVSADLASGELTVHREGLLRDAVLASMSIPGLMPPVRLDGRLLVDGGLLDNFPVDVMRELDEGPVIGIDVMRQFPLAEAERGPASKGLKDAIGPGIISTLARAMVLGGRSRAEQNRADADLLITPDVHNIGLFDFDRIDDATEAGRRAADEALACGLPWE